MDRLPFPPERSASFRTTSFFFLSLNCLSPLLLYLTSYAASFIYPSLEPVESCLWLCSVSLLSVISLSSHWYSDQPIFIGLSMSVFLWRDIFAWIFLLFPGQMLVMHYQDYEGLIAAAVFVLFLVAMRENLLDFIDGHISLLCASLVPVLFSVVLSIVYMRFALRLESSVVEGARGVSPYLLTSLTALGLFQTATEVVYYSIFQLYPSPIDLTVGRSFFQIRERGILYYNELSEKHGLVYQNRQQETDVDSEYEPSDDEEELETAKEDNRIVPDHIRRFHADLHHLD